MSGNGFDENPFGEPNLDNPFAVSLTTKFCWWKPYAHSHSHAYTHAFVYVYSPTKLWDWVYVLCVCVCACCRCNDDNTYAYLHMYVCVPPTLFKLQLIFVEFSFYRFFFYTLSFSLMSRILPYSRRHVRQPRWPAACNHWRIIIPLRSKWSHNCRSTRPIRQPLFNRSHRMFRLRSRAHWVHRRPAPAYRSLRRSCRY